MAAKMRRFGGVGKTDLDGPQTTHNRSSPRKRGP